LHAVPTIHIASCSATACMLAGAGWIGAKPTPIPARSHGQIRQHYCPKFDMTELPAAIKTELQIIWMSCDAKFRNRATIRNDLSSGLAQRETALRPILALERQRESRHCPRRLQDQENQAGTTR
jgi:hypothetical protein